MKNQYIYIFNLPEDVWPFVTSISNKKDYSSEIEWCANVAERDLITIAKERSPIFICPKLIDHGYIEYIKSLFGIKKITILNPQKSTGEICKDILYDKDIISNLSKFKNLTITSYTASSQFSILVDKLRNLGIKVTTPELPIKENLWTVNYYGSKSGIRETVPNQMADGVICNSIEEATKKAFEFNKKGKLGIVIKTDKGHGGEGIEIIKKDSLTELKLKEVFSGNKYWSKFPIVIENLLDVVSTPNVEFLIESNGKVNFLYYCSMRVDQNGFYKGQEVHRSVLSKTLAKKLTKIGFSLGKIYSKSGYKGCFDVDFIVDKNNKVFVTESNIRHTGGTHMYKAGVNLFGKDFMNKVYVLSNNDYLLPDKKFNFLKIKNLLNPILFNNKSREGIIIASSNLIKLGMFSYIIFGKTKRRALDIEARMGVLLEHGYNS